MAELVDVEVREDGYTVLWGPVVQPATLEVNESGRAVLFDPETCRGGGVDIPAEALAEVVERHQLTADLRRQLEQARSAEEVRRGA